MESKDSNKESSTATPANTPIEEATEKSFDGEVRLVVCKQIKRNMFQVFVKYVNRTGPDKMESQEEAKP